MKARYRRLALPAPLADAALLGGCASFSADGGLAGVEQTAKDLHWARTDADQDRIDKRVAELLAKPLTMDDAVEVALLNNRGLQASFQDLGITEAEVVQARRLPNPGFSFGRLTRGGGVELERGLHFNLARILALLPFFGQMEARRFVQTKGTVSMRVLSLAADTRKAWVNALAAEETVRYMRQVKETADASSELARRMEQVGNFNKLQRAREQGFYADAALNLALAEQAQRSTRERLTRLLGAWGAQTQFSLPERLPDLPAAALDLPDVERVALAQRLDVQGARLAAEQTARNLGLTRTTRFISVLGPGLRNNRSNEAPTQRGWEIGLELPLFDWRGARVVRAEAVYMQTLHLAAETAINARSEVREAYTGYRSAYDIARHHRDEIVPLRQRIAEENQLHHPTHLYGHEFLVTGTDGEPTPRSARKYEVTADVAVGQMRQIDFLADEEGDWAFHCHKSHHTMNAMGHDVPTMIGVDHRGVARQITRLIPDYMVMGERGMKDMTEMEMPLPDNTAAMMAGQGPFGAVGMGGMFSVMKVRRNQLAGNYKDPGWYKHPPGTVACEFTGALPDPARFKAEGTGSMPPARPKTDTEVTVRKPSAGSSQHKQH